MANNLTVDQIFSIANNVVSQAIGNSLTTVDLSNFATLATTDLKSNYDPVLGKISQLLTKTIYAARPYSRKFKGLEADAQAWGNHTRKINYLHKKAIENKEYATGTDGQSIDQYIIDKPKVVQTNFYGQGTLDYEDTIYRDQLDTAFEGPEQFGNFISGVMVNASNDLEQQREELARATVCNLIGARAESLHGGSNVVGKDGIGYIKLITDFYTETAGTPPSPIPTIYQMIASGDIKDFAPWAIARIKRVMDIMERRNMMYHAQPTYDDSINPFYELLRHTPKKDQHVYLLSEYMTLIESVVFSQTFHDEYLKLADYEAVAYWQTPATPGAINVKANYMQTSSSATIGKIASVTYSSDNVLGVIFDRDAAGYTVHKANVDTTPFNARGKYYNIYYSGNTTYWCDTTENAVVLLLE